MATTNRLVIGVDGCWNGLDVVIVVDVVIDITAPRHSMVPKALLILRQYLPKSIVNGLCDMNHCDMKQYVT